MDIGKFIDEMHAIRAEKRYHEAEVKRINAVLSSMESQLMIGMEAHGTTEARGKMGKAAIKSVLLPKVEDWAALWADIRETNNFGLLHKRITLDNYRQLVEENQDPAGTLRNYVNEVFLGNA
jgi:hypothetical protein